MIFRLLPIAVILAAAGSSACLAQAPETPAPAATSDTRTLTEAQRNAILDGNTVESAAAARGEMGESGSALRNIHGEVGVMVGSNGLRSTYGAAEIPLGDNAGAVVTFESTRFGRYRR